MYKTYLLHFIFLRRSSSPIDRFGITAGLAFCGGQMWRRNDVIMKRWLSLMSFCGKTLCFVPPRHILRMYQRQSRSYPETVNIMEIKCLQIKDISLLSHCGSYLALISWAFFITLSHSVMKSGNLFRASPTCCSTIWNCGRKKSYYRLWQQQLSVRQHSSLVTTLCK